MAARAHRRRVVDIRFRRGPRGGGPHRARGNGAAHGTGARGDRPGRDLARQPRGRSPRDADRERRPGCARGAARRNVSPLSERLRLILERAQSGFRLRDAATGEIVRWEDPRILVIPVAGVSFRADALDDPSFEPGRVVALVPEPDNEHDPNAVAVWNEARTLQVGYVPRDIAPELKGDEQAVSLWRVEGGLRVLIVPADAWVGRPR